jgi:carbamoyltransferase
MSKSNAVLGVSAFYHDSAAAMVVDGHLIAAAQEERFTRKRHDGSFPGNAVRYCLDAADVRLDDVTSVAFYESPRIKLRRVVATYLATAPNAFHMFRASAPAWLTWKRRAGNTIRRELDALGRGTPPRIEFIRHHHSHAASAYLPSPYPSSAVLCIDGVGEWDTTTIWRGQGATLQPLANLSFPHSLGLLYSAFTYFCGFKVDSGEYKLMGLAPYGRPRYADLIMTHLITIRDDGSFRLNMDYFDFLHGEVMTGRAFENMFDGPRRMRESPLTQREFDLAASIQHVTEQIVVAIARHARRITGESTLCLAGGVALNCVANGVLSRAKIFDEVWVQPAAGDAGGAVGAALVTASKSTEVRPDFNTSRDGMHGALLGPSYTDDEIHAFLTERSIPAQLLEPSLMLQVVAEHLASGKVVGWFQGRMEFGPRALGSRSILGDPRNPHMQSTLNLKTKFRESFRPFAPAVLAEEASAFFDLSQPSPYMSIVAPVNARQRVHTTAPPATGIERLHQIRSTIPAVTHVDYSARIQTVDKATNPIFHDLLAAFNARTGCPVLINTSFNVRGEPIVRSPEDAYTCFMRTNIDTLVLGNFVLHKEDQPQRQQSYTEWRDLIPVD